MAGLKSSYVSAKQARKTKRIEQMAQPNSKRRAERAPEDAPQADRRERDTPKDVWDVNPQDPEVDQRVIITDWASI